MISRNAVRIRLDMTLGDVARQITPDIDLSGYEHEASVLVGSVLHHTMQMPYDFTVMLDVQDSRSYDECPGGMSYCVAIGLGAMGDVAAGAWNFCLGDDTQLPSPNCNGFVNLGNRLCFWRETGEIVPCWVTQRGGCA